jgi:hypothetical protein
LKRQPAGLPDFSWYNIPKWGKIYKMTAKLPNAHEMYPMVIKYYKWPENITTFSIARFSEIYPNWDFWSEKKPLATLVNQSLF